MTRPTRRLSLTTLATPGRDLEAIVELALRHGFQGIDLRHSDHQGQTTPAMSIAEIELVGRQVRDAGLVIPTLLAYSRPDPSASNWQAAYLAELGRLLDVATALGALRLRIFGLPRVEIDSSSEAVERIETCAEVLRAALSAASSAVGIVVQNHGGTSGALECAALAERVGSDRFGLAYSPDHTIVHDAEPIEAQLPIVAPHTQIVYIAAVDPERALEGVHQPVPFGPDSLPFVNALQVLEAQGFAGFVSLKWEKLWYPGLPPIEAAVGGFLRYFA